MNVMPNFFITQIKHLSLQNEAVFNNARLPGNMHDSQKKAPRRRTHIALVILIYIKASYIIQKRIMAQRA